MKRLKYFEAFNNLEGSAITMDDIIKTIDDGKNIYATIIQEIPKNDPEVPLKPLDIDNDGLITIDYNGKIGYVKLKDVERIDETKIVKKITKELAEESFKDFVNWDLIEDLKDLSLEHIDNGYTLSYNIIYEKPYNVYNGEKYYTHNEIGVLSGIFNHTIDKVTYLSTSGPDKSHLLNIDSRYIKYKIKLFTRELLTSDEYKKGFEYSNEILEIIKSMYPNEKISCIH